MRRFITAIGLCAVPVAVHAPELNAQQLTPTDVKTAPLPLQAVSDVHRAMLGLTGQQTPARSAHASAVGRGAAAPEPKREPLDPGADPAADPLADRDLVLFDRPGDGALWAAARRYKVRFDADGATFIPYLGAAAPSRQVRLSLRSVDVDGAPLPLPQRVEPRHRDRRVTFDHGVVSEHYDLGPQQMEQSFVFGSLPRRGEVRVRIDLSTGLRARACGDGGFRFETDNGGGVSYSGAVAFDRTGRRIALDSTCDGGVIEIRVPAAFVAQAALPLTIDPLVGSIQPVYGANATLREPDIAYDVTRDRYLVVFEVVASSTDSDVYSYELEPSGRVVPNSWAAIDISLRSWQLPKVANNRHASRNLVVAQVSENSSSPFHIAGRMRDAGLTRTGTQFRIADATLAGHVAGDKINPDVGGDPNHTDLLGLTYFTVVWERVYSPTDHDIHMRQVTHDLFPIVRTTPPIYIDNSVADERRPAISSGCGPAPKSLQQWCVAYERSDNLGEIRTAFVDWDGLVQNRGAAYVGVSTIDGSPSVSSPTETDRFGRRLYFVTWEQGYITLGGDTNDIFGTVLDGSNGNPVSLGTNLTGLEPEESGVPHRRWNQFDPQVDSDGCRFAVTYSEDWFDLRTDFDVRVSTFDYRAADATLGAIRLTESRAWVAPTTAMETQPAIVATHSGGGEAVRYAIPFHDDHRSPAGDWIRIRLYDGMSPAGGVTRIPTGCSGLDITLSGTPALGGVLQIAGGAGADGLLFGLPIPPVTICPGLPCQLGTPGDVFQTPLTVPVPCIPGIVGGTVAFQAFDLTGGTCLGGLRASDTLAVTIR